MATPRLHLITADTLRLAEGYVQVKSLGPVNVKGMNEPVEVFEVTGVGARLVCKLLPRADSLALSGAMLKPSSFEKHLNKHAQTMVRWSVS